jgi:hypothetical protein
MNRTEALDLITKFPIEKFAKKIAHLKLSEKRVEQFFNVIDGKEDIDQFYRFDIEEFALKAIFPIFYKDIQTIQHRYSSCENYEFDPAKNGQNIIKHGIGFGEVISYSRNFGTLFIPCPDDGDIERLIIFSDLVLESDCELELPLAKINGTSYTLSIGKQIDGKMRFISSRLLSSQKKKYTETVRQLIKKIEFLTDESRESFIESCLQIIERDLILKGSK